MDIVIVNLTLEIVLHTTKWRKMKESGMEKKKRFM